jgi:hypothetical protein
MSDYGKNILNIINSNLGTEHFGAFLKKEHNEELLLCYLKTKDLLQTSEYISEETFHKNFEKFINTNFENFNFQGDLLSEICESLLLSEISIEETSNFEMKTKRIGVLKKIIENLRINFMDPYLRFEISDEYENYIKIKKEMLKKTNDMIQITKEKEWVFNNTTTQSIKIEKDPVLCSQLLFEQILNFVKTKGFQIKGKEMKEEFFHITEKINELHHVKIKGKKTDEKICFYINIFSILFLHVSILLHDIPPSSSEEFQCLLHLCSYNINGKTKTLKKILEKIGKNFRRLGNEYPAGTVYFSLQVLFKSGKIQPMTLLNIHKTIVNNSKEYLRDAIEVNEDKMVFPEIINDIITEAIDVQDAKYRTNVMEYFQNTKTEEEEDTHKNKRKNMNLFGNEKLKLNLEVEIKKFEEKKIEEDEKKDEKRKSFKQFLNGLGIGKHESSEDVYIKKNEIKEHDKKASQRKSLNIFLYKSKKEDKSKLEDDKKHKLEEKKNKIDDIFKTNNELKGINQLKKGIRELRLKNIKNNITKNGLKDNEFIQEDYDKYDLTVNDIISMEKLYYMKELGNETTNKKN